MPLSVAHMTPRIVAVVVVLAAALAARMLVGDGGDGEDRNDMAGGTSVVTRVIDGDTAVLSKVGKSRFIGVDTPEVYGRRECFGAQASAFARRVLERRRIRYAVGVQPRDRYGRALIYAWLEDGRSFNEMLVSQGYARPLPIAPNVRYADLFRRRASVAREARRGLWSATVCR